MNFLAHLVLAPQTPQGLVGSIAPDLVRGPLPADLDPAVREAAKEHQWIDRFTDSHPAHARSRRRLTECVDSRLSGIVADVLYDHVLAHGWSGWRQDRLAGYVASAERLLVQGAPFMPAPMRVIVERMLGEQWLVSYASASGLRQRLTQMSRRLSARVGRPMDLTMTIDQIEHYREQTIDDFAELWRGLSDGIQRRRDTNHAPRQSA